jgi:hypothetical protein
VVGAECLGGGYTQGVRDRITGRELHATGRWRYDARDHTVTFESGFLAHMGSPGKLLDIPRPCRGWVALTTCKVLGTVRIEEGDILDYEHE